MQRIVDHFADQLWPLSDDNRAYAVLDAGADKRAFDRMQQSGLPSVCLWRGEVSEELRRRAPYIVELAPENPLTGFLSGAAGRNWSIFARSAVPLSELAAHFHNYLLARHKGGAPRRVAFYRPAVLRVWLSLLPASESSQALRPVERLICNGETPDTLNIYRPVPSNVNLQLLHLRTGFSIDAGSDIQPSPNQFADFSIRPTPGSRGRSSSGGVHVLQMRQAQLHVLGFAAEEAVIGPPQNDWLELSPEQVDRLDWAEAQAVIHSFAKRLRSSHPQIVQNVDEFTLGQMVSKGVQRALAYGMSSEAALFGFVELMFLVAPNFDDLESAAAILNDHSISPDLRVTALIQKLSTEDWASARDAYDPDAWCLEA